MDALGNYIPILDILPVAQFILGLPFGEKVECSWLLFRCYRWPRGHYPRIRLCWCSYVPHITSSTPKLIFISAAAVLFGVVAGTACNFATQLKYLAHYDDALDVDIFLLVLLMIDSHLSDLRVSRCRWYLR
jgi:hypothetical protein